jgi:hypothetical protein
LIGLESQWQREQKNETMRFAGAVDKDGKDFYCRIYALHAFCRLAALACVHREILEYLWDVVLDLAAKYKYLVASRCGVLTIMLYLTF